MYVPPSDSTYFDDVYFANLRLLIQHFRHCTFIICGDLNSRIGDIVHNNQEITHVNNPDQKINTNGRNLRYVLEDNVNLVVINGCIRNKVVFDSNFTFHRGLERSQIDILLTNDIENIVDAFVEKFN